MSFFGGNPFSTPVGQMIEQATDASLASENWALNMEICDLINENEDGPKDAIKAIRKRLQQNAGKNYTVVMYTLTVLETCVKNCERRFHLLATNKEFVQELVKLIGPKNDPPTAVQEKVLSLIQSWADAFKIIPEMSGVVQVYQDLKQKGVEFPMTDLDSLAPIHTPQRSVPEVEQPVRQPRAPPTRLAAGVTAPGVPSPTAGTGSVTLTAEQLAKLRSELDVVQGNMNVFSEMLTELSPGQEHPSDLELLQDLNKTCKSMQVRIVELIDKVGNEEVTNELLRINDDLNNIFLRYARFEKNRSQSHQLSPGHTETNQAKTPEESPLIDLSEEAPGSQSDIHLRLAGISVGPGNVSSTLSQMNTVTAQQGKGAEDEFDMFAQSRTATYEKSKQTGSTYQDNSNVDQVNASLGAIAQNRLTPSKLQSEKDFDEMEAWLEGKPTGAAPDSQQDSITSSEFDRFLADRAAAAENLPSTNSTPSRSAGRRQIEKDEAENTLFAL